MRWMAMFVLVSVPLFACGGDDDMPRCASPADCEAGEVCINGRCMPGTDGGEDARDSATDDGGEEDAGDDVGVDAGEEDAPIDVVPDTFDAGPLTCPGPGGARNDPIVLYTFAAPDDATTITDRAPAVPDVPLIDNTGTFTIDNADSGSVAFEAGRLAADLTASDALMTELLAAGSLAVEVWFSEDDLILEETSAPERIVTLSLDSAERAFTVGQDREALVGRFRTDTTDLNGTSCDEPVVGDARPPRASIVEDGAMDATTVKHVVLSFDSAEGRPRMYLNGVEVGEPGACRVGALNWPTGLYRLALGDEFVSDRAWEGVIHRVAIYARPMSEAEAACWHGAGRDADVFR